MGVGFLKGWKAGLLREAAEYGKIILVALVATNIINVSLFTLSQVRQSSMETTLMEGDQLVVEKISYTFGKPQAGDIVVFIKDGQVKDDLLSRLFRLYGDMRDKFSGQEGRVRLVKRIVAEPGDLLDVKEGQVYVNGEVLEEPYTQDVTWPGKVEYPYKVPAGTYFAMGDNRDVSLDSRDFGSVPEDNIEGRVIFRIFPFENAGRVR
ncbi:signal peptidase I [Anaerotalea alkaliphila]|uniref:Signal peptidase I n=1 Tax=Anaerotalea alkaliphila TaxID=2662126 RepID=A0A7X5KMV6_9FIRM|nr:signal peptidase I [Anaerotalea alkaliphila]NDL67098.1 signal peptidase I [Anaerotalea alkaliphila]